MIKEAYVSFETAKLLKEKGFEQICDKMYKLNGKICNNPKSTPNWYIKMWYPCATLQMAMAWLREVHNIVIEINMEDYMTSENGELQVWYSYTIWTFIRHLGETGLVDIRYDDRAFWQENVKVGQSYEEACEAALDYVLKNLI